MEKYFLQIQSVLEKHLCKNIRYIDFPTGFRTTPATPTATPFLDLTHRRRRRRRRIQAEEVEEGVGATARVLTASGQTTTVTRTSTAPPAHSRLTEEQPEAQQRRRRQRRRRRPRRPPPQLVSCRAVGVADSLNSSNPPLTWQLLVRPRQTRLNTTSTISSPFQTLSQSHQVSS